ncbi:hypothetical protein M0804_004342 [Polistes exclamans]|nr:hypothetical protein M0804_004342 [Polistes exclamans]
MSCSEVMYQYYHPYLYSRAPPPPHPTHPHAAPHANPHAAHHSPARPAPFQPFSSATATHQYDRKIRRENKKDDIRLRVTMEIELADDEKDEEEEDDDVRNKKIPRKRQ